MSDTPADVTNVFKHQLHLYEPWKNPESILVLIGERAKFDDTTLATRVNIYVPIADIVDFYDGLYKAYIHSDDYGTICLEKPSIAGYLRRKAGTVQGDEAQEHKESKIVEQHKIVAVSCKKKGNERQNRCRLELKLPSGMTASNVAYNGTVSGLDLQTRLRRVGVKASVTVPDKTATNQDKTRDVVVEQAHFFLVISLVIDGTQVASDDTKSSTKEADALAELLGAPTNFYDEHRHHPTPTPPSDDNAYSRDDMEFDSDDDFGSVDHNRSNEDEDLLSRTTVGIQGLVDEGSALLQFINEGRMMVDEEARVKRGVEEISEETGGTETFQRIQLVPKTSSLAAAAAEEEDDYPFGDIDDL